MTDRVADSPIRHGIIDGIESNRATGRAGVGFVLAAILLTGAALRFTGLDYGLPLKLRPDEDYYSSVVERMVREDTPDPGFFAYPALPFYLEIVAARAAHAVAGGGGSFEDFVRDEPAMIRMQRWISALLGTLTILLVFALGRRLGGNAAALSGAAFLAAAPISVRHAHFGVADTPSAFFTTLALLAILRAGERRTLWSLSAAAAACGAAIATKYTPAALLLPLAWVAAAGASAAGAAPPSVAARAGRVALAVALAVAVFLAIAPYTVLAFERFRTHLEAQGGAAPFVLADALDRFRVLAADALGGGLTWPLAAAAAAGCALLPALARRRAAAVWLFVLAFLAVIVAGSRCFHRYVLPLVPVLCAAAGALVASTGRLGRPVPAVLTAALLAVPALESVRIASLFRTPTSFELLREALAGAEHPERVVFADPMLESILELPASRVTPYDPPDILGRGEPVLLVLATHPVLDAAAPPIDLRRWEAHAEIRPAMTIEVTEARPPDEVYEAADLCYFPVRASAQTIRAGPRLEVLRLIPRPGAVSTPAPTTMPGRVTATVPPLEVSAIVASWDAVPADDALAWYVRCIPDGAVTTAEAFREWPRRSLPGGIRFIVIARLAPGTYRVAVSAAGASGEGPPAVSESVDLRH